MSTTSQKLTYLSETKSQLKDMINYGLDTGEKITSETTFRNYVKSLFDAFIKTMTYPDVLYNNLPKVTGTGTSVTLNGTAEAPMKIELSPSELEQGANPSPDYPQEIHTVSGENSVKIQNKNLLNLLNLETIAIGYVNSGYRVLTNNSDYVGYVLNVENLTNLTISRKNTTDFSRFRFGFTNEKPVHYTLAYNENWANGMISRDNSTSVTLTIPNQAKYLVMYLSNTSETITSSSELQVEIGSSQTTYESHQEQSLPLSLGSLEYCKIGDYEDGFIRTSGKNLLNPIGETLSDKGITFTNNGDGTFTVNGTASEAVNFSLTNLTTFPITLEANKPYTQTLDIISGTFGGSIVPAFKNNGGTVTYNYFNCNASSRIDTKTPTENMIAHTYNLYLGAGLSITNCTFRVQLEQNSQSTPYEPYNDGKWYLKKNIGKVVLDGSESGWGIANTGTSNWYFRISYTTDTTSTINGLSNYYPVVTISNSNTTQGVGIVSGFFRIRWGTEDTIENFKTWLNTHNVSVYYSIATPTYTLLSDTLQTQLEAIWRANSYEGQTNVSQENNDLPFVIKISAIRDLSGIFELIQE